MYLCRPLLILTLLCCWNNHCIGQDSPEYDPYLTFPIDSIAPLDYKLTFDFKGITVQYFSEYIWSKTHRQAFFRDDYISSQEVIDIKAHNATLNTILRGLLKPRGLGWYHRHNIFVILPADSARRLGIALEGDTEPFSGRVTDINGTPLPYVTVVVKETIGSKAIIGARTDEKGFFKFNYDQDEATLLISCMGYENRTIKVDKEPVNVVLHVSTSLLDEVRIAGYGKTTKRFATGTISQVDAREISSQPTASLLDALQGRVAGFNITQLSGLPGSNAKLELRGRNSLGSGNIPLFIVNGVALDPSSLNWDFENTSGPGFLPFNAIGLGANLSSSPLNLINLADVESVAVLKDADATAIYGSRGANGVVIINTKIGKTSDPKMAFTFYGGVGQVEHQVSYLNTTGYLAMRKEAFLNDRSAPGPLDYDVNGAWDTARYTNWQKTLIGGVAGILDAQGEVSGGSENVHYRFSGGYRQESTAYPGDFLYKKGNGRLDINFNSSSHRWYNNIGVGYVSDDNFLPATDLTAFSSLPPNAPAAFKSDNTLNIQPGFDNPYAAMRKDYRAQTDNLLANATSSYMVTKQLQIKGCFGYSRVMMDELQRNPVSSFNTTFPAAKGYAFYGNTAIKNFVAEPQLTYDKNFAVGSLSLLAGFTIQHQVRNQKLITGTGFSSDGDLNDLSKAGQISAVGANNSVYHYNAYFGRLNYIHQKKYVINLTGRRDGSSRFGPAERYATFGAVGMAWLFSEESWFAPLNPVLSFGKLRFSYGITGNDQVRDYQSMANLNAGAAPGADSVRKVYLADNHYTWEKVSKADYGIDAGLFNDRFIISATYYRNHTSNMIIEELMAGTNQTYWLRNMDARVINSGWELELTANLLKRKGFSWKVRANYAWPKNVLTRLPQVANPAYDRYYTVGYSLNNFKGLRYQGVDPASGIYRFTDVNGDGKISRADINFNKPLGTSGFGAILQTISIKGLDIDILLQYVRQNGFDYRYVNQPPGPGAISNQPVTVLNRWQHDGQQAAIQQFSQSINSPAYLPFLYVINSDYAVSDASYLRVKNISISYHLPAGWMKREKICGAEIFFRGQNLLTLTSYRGRNPEVSFTGADIYPPLRIWSFGTRVSL